MRKLALKLYACPSCKHAPLTLSKKREEVVFSNYETVLDDESVIKLFTGDSVNDIADMYLTHVKNAHLICDECKHVYEVKDFIPHLRVDQAAPPEEYNAEKYEGDAIKKTEKLSEGEEKKKELTRRVKKLLPFDRAKKERAKKNLEHDLEYRVNHSEKDKYVHLFEQYLSKKPDVVLEIGIGQGGFTSSVKKLVTPKIFFGLDYEREWLDVAKLRDFETECVVADGRNMPFRDDAFDLMYSAYTLEHVPQVEKLVKETGRLTQEAFYIFGPSSWSPFDFHFEKAPLLPLMPKALALRMAYYWKVTRAGFDYTRDEIKAEYATMNYINPGWFERQCKKYGLDVTPLLYKFLHYSFANSYQYHGIMKLAKHFEFLIVPVVRLIESMKMQPIMVYFLQRKKSK